MGAAAAIRGHLLYLFHLSSTIPRPQASDKRQDLVDVVDANGHDQYDSRPEVLPFASTQRDACYRFRLDIDYGED